MTDSEKLDYLIEQVAGIKKDNLGIKGEIAGMKEEIAGIKGEIAGIKGEIKEMKVDIRSLQKRMDRQEEETRKIRLFQENVLEPNIKVIAEGHANLNRRLNEALKISEDDEMLRIRVNVLECDMSKVKDKLAMA